MKTPVPRYWGLPAVNGVRVFGPPPAEIDQPPPPPPPPAEGITWAEGFTGTITSGPYADGTVVTITRNTGTFGAKDEQSTYAFDDHEDGVLGEPVSRPWFRTSPSVLAGVFANDHVYSGTKSLKADWNTNAHSGHQLAFNAQCIYVSARFRLEEYPGQINTGDAPQLKGFYFTKVVGEHAPSAGAISGGHSNVIGLPSSDGLAYDRMIRDQLTAITGTNNIVTGSGFYGGEQFGYPTWNRLEYFWLLNTGFDNPDGIRYIKTNGDGRFRYSGWPAGAYYNAPTDPSIPHTAYWGQRMVNRAVGHTGNIVQGFYPFYKRSQQRLAYWLDEIYMDQAQDQRAQARFELGPSGGGDDSRLRNPCRYEAWSPTSVTLRLNAGPNGIAGRSLYFVSGEGVFERLLEFNA